MNTIKVKIDFEKRKNSIIGVDLTSGDYNSTKMIFDFDREDGIKVFELKNPKGELVFTKEIENNEIILTKIEEDGTFSSIFDMAGDYIFEVSLYANEGKLTSDYAYLPVEPEQVIIGDTISEPYLPIFDELIQKLNNAITETNNLDINMENSVITITKKDGTTKSENVKGDKGEKGDPGAVKMQFLKQLPETGKEDTLYFIAKEEPTEKDIYDEWAWVNKGTDEEPIWDWEHLGSPKVVIDLTDYVKNTDYAGYSQKGIIGLNGNALQSGLQIQNGMVSVFPANQERIDAKTSWATPIVPNFMDYAWKVSATTNTEEWTDEEKASVRTLIDAVGSTDYATESIAGVAKVNYVYGLRMSSDHTIRISPATNSEINDRTSTYKPIVPSNLNYAVKSVVGGHETLTQTEYDKLVANGTYTKEDGTVLTYSDDDYYNIVEE